MGFRPAPVRFASFAPRVQARPLLLILLAGLAVGSWQLVERHTGRLSHPAYTEMMKAASTMRAAMAVVRAEKEQLGILQDLETDPNRTALIGSDFTSMTTTLGVLEVKRTATNPDLAATLVRLIAELDLPQDARVAIVTSGSMVGGNIAAIAAVEAIALEPVLVSSAGASMYGATDPEMTWLDIENRLLKAGVIATSPTAGVIGGGRAVGAGLDPSGRAAILDAFWRTETPLFDDEPLSLLVEEVEAKILKGGPVDLVINVGGSVIALGNCREGAELPVGYSREVLPCSDTPGLLVRFSQREVPLVHLLDIRSLAIEWGLPYDPIPLPTPGNNRRVYGGSAIHSPIP